MCSKPRLVSSSNSLISKTPFSMMIWLLSPIAPSNLFDVEVEVSNGSAAIEDLVVSNILFVEVEMD